MCVTSLKTDSNLNKNVEHWNMESVLVLPPCYKQWLKFVYHTNSHFCFLHLGFQIDGFLPQWAGALLQQVKKRFEVCWNIGISTLIAAERSKAAH